MSKYIVSFEEYAFYTIPVEAGSLVEAREKARAKLEETPAADYRHFTLADSDEIGEPNPEEVDADTFERFGGVAA